MLVRHCNMCIRWWFQMRPPPNGVVNLHLVPHAQMREVVCDKILCTRLRRCDS
jgi:hypothetical protein